MLSAKMSQKTAQTLCGTAILNGNSRRMTSPLYGEFDEENSADRADDIQAAYPS